MQGICGLWMRVAPLVLLLASAACASGEPSDAAGQQPGAVAAPAGGAPDAPAPTWRPGTAVRLADPLPVRNPYTGDAQAVLDGQRLFNWYNCSGCHSAGAGGGMGPALIDDAWIYGGDDARVFESIWSGRQAGMPAWAEMIPEDEIWKIIAFIREAPPKADWPWSGGS